MPAAHKQRPKQSAAALTQPPCPQGEQAHHAAAGVPGQHELPHHHDRAHLGRGRELRGDPVHHPDRLEGLEDEEEENEGKGLAAVMIGAADPGKAGPVVPTIPDGRAGAQGPLGAGRPAG